jgi:hypothetical protein
MIASSAEPSRSAGRPSHRAVIAGVSPARPVRLAITACLFAVLVPAAAGLAQNAPTPLLPGAGAPSAGQPSESASPAPAPQKLGPPGGDERPFPEVTSPRPDRIQVRDLGSLDADAIGVLDESQGGFGTDMWAGTDMAVVQKTLPMLPAVSESRTIRGLERRLLLTAAAVPSGKSGGIPLIRLRAAKLMAMGDLDGLQALLKAVPTPAVTPDLRRLRAETALLLGDNATACEQVVALKGEASSDAFPAKLQVYCQFASGKTREAGLGVDLLREDKVSDAAFFTAADALQGIKPAKIDGLGNPTALTLAMARAAKLPLPESAVAGNLPPAVLRTIALLPDATIEARLIAAEKAEAVGALDTEALRKLYESVTFNPQELSGPLGAAATDKGVRSRALLFQAAERQSMPTAKAEIVAKALSLAGDGPAYFTAARLYGPEIAGLRPTPELSWFALPAARALFAARNPGAASPWVRFARAQGVDGAAALWPLARLAAEDDKPVSAAAVAAWSKARGVPPGDAGQRRTAVMLSLLAAMGDRLPAESWLPLLDGPPLVAATGPRPALWQGLRISTDDLRLGETVLLSLVSLGDGLNQADPTTLYRVIAALRLIGLDTDARALAEEAAIANGV